MLKKFFCNHQWRKHQLLKTEYSQSYPDVETWEYYCPKCGSFKKVRDI